MANITPTIVLVRGQQGLDGWQVTWAGFAASGDVGIGVGSTIGDNISSLGILALPAPGGAAGFSGFADKTIAAAGTFTGTPSLAFEGSNDAGANWWPLTTPTGVVIAFTAGGLSAVTEAALWYRPHLTAGTGGASITATCFFRKTQTP